MVNVIVRKIYMEFVLHLRFDNKKTKSKNALISAIIMGNKSEILKATPNNPIEISSVNFSLLYTVIMLYVLRERVVSITIIKESEVKYFLFINSTSRDKINTLLYELYRFED